MSAWVYLAAVLGCGAGACVRFSIGWLDRAKTFPWPTIAANALGAALVGAVMALADDALLTPGWTFALATGVAGGLSTLSSLAVDVVVLAKDRRARAAVAYLALTLTLGVGAAWVAYAVAASIA